MSFKRNPNFNHRLRSAVIRSTRKAGEALTSSVRQVLQGARGTGVDYPTLRNVSSSPGDPPVIQSGQLHDSIETGDIVVSGSAVTIRVGTDLMNGRFMEAGTRFTAPRPFLRPGLTASQPEVMACFKDAMKGDA